MTYSVNDGPKPRDNEGKQRKDARPNGSVNRGVTGPLNNVLTEECWRVLEVAPSGTKDDIVRNYRQKIRQCHLDRVAGLSSEFRELAEERSKALNAAYAQAMRA